MGALGVFRQWLDDTYVPRKLPNYLKGKVKRNDLPPSVAEMLLSSLEDEPKLPEGR